MVVISSPTKDRFTALFIEEKKLLAVSSFHLLFIFIFSGQNTAAYKGFGVWRLNE
jgi:hypothetical protein